MLFFTERQFMNKRQLAGFFFLLLALAFIRNPAFLLEPRIWAEEGTIYIQTYLERGFWGSLFLPHLGYYSFFNNVVVALGMSVFGLKWIAFSLSYASLIVMLLVLASPLFLTSSLWDTLEKKLLLIVFSLLIGTAEIWLNTVNMQFFLGLYSCYYLLSDNEKLRPLYLWIARALLLTASLSGVTSVILLPFFLTKAWQSRRLKSHRTFTEVQISSAIVTFGFFVQILCYFFSTNEYAFARLSPEFIKDLPAGLQRTFLFVFYGSSTILTKLTPLPFLFFGFISCKNSLLARYAFLLVLYVAFVFTILSIGMLGGERYGYIVSVLLVLLLLNGVFATEKITRILSYGFLLIFLIHKAEYFLHTDLYYDKSWNSYSSEYSRFLAGETSELQIFPQWPNTDWKIVVP